MEELQARHRKEQRDLQSKITQKRKSATKKTRKGVNDECANLERKLNERQEQELSEVNGEIHTHGVTTSEIDEAAEEPENVEIDGKETSGTEKSTKNFPMPASAEASLHADSALPTRKPNRAKARLARRAAEQDALIAQATQEAANLPDLREQERAQMLDEFQKRGLREKEIRADGHCLYSAVADQMEQLGLGLESRILHKAVEGADQNKSGLPGYKTVREAAAEYIVQNADDFAPFLEEPLDQYVHKVKDTGEWGGQLELMALAKTYGVEINVLQGGGRVEKIEPEAKVVDNGKKIWLAYYRHGFGLGEHYNSLRKAP
ncbi:hypothetical protein B0A49_08557 [Cryomyces minteri]|uniref:OTU domain-containing protein n=1 Tax=Cryomyces minteri TaxID=331657 RepID=A0A4U0WQK7_9PEZI|nr:hypothetical protein B0A49_08557 [Cryomyces minteri]